MHLQAGLEDSATWLDFHLTGWFELYEMARPEGFEPPAA
ncbi:MAG: hypothetical protein HW377_618 [Actinobacteria bacterium]|nr:hypothetical protein [Actinomycetota bacterium]